MAFPPSSGLGALVNGRISSKYGAAMSRYVAAVAPKALRAFV